jgi:hypothetical protein
MHISGQAWICAANGIQKKAIFHAPHTVMLFASIAVALRPNQHALASARARGARQMMR